MVEINNTTADSLDEDFVRKVAEKVLEGETKKGATLSIAFVERSLMRQLNRKYRGKDRSTDVLAFPEQQLFRTPPGIPTDLGEVILSLRDVKENAKRFHVPIEQELARILIHGILHILGYEHEKSKKEAKRMFAKQEYYLEQLHLQHKTQRSK
jgi:probable rRNA maturation factor